MNLHVMVLGEERGEQGSASAGTTSSCFLLFFASFPIFLPLSAVLHIVNEVGERLKQYEDDERVFYPL